MDGSADPMTRLGVTNQKWGVCGFTSSLYAMYDLNPTVRPQVINATSAFRILAEIKTYLVMLKADNSPLLADIRAFTRSFGGPYSNFTVDDYINRINTSAAMGLSRDQVLSDPLYSIALPPQAVADYVIRLWGWKAAVSEITSGEGNGDGIIGVGAEEYNPNGVQMPYRGIKHYMYRTGNQVYSWGQSFNSVQAAADAGAGGANWRVRYVIAITRP